MIARGKRRAKRSASPLERKQNDREALKERNKTKDISHFQCSVLNFAASTRGDALRCAPRLPLAIIFRAVGAKFTMQKKRRAF